MLKMTNGRMNEKAGRVWERVDKMVEEREVIMKKMAEAPIDD